MVRDFKKENCLAAPVDYANIPPFYLFIFFFNTPNTVIPEIITRNREDREYGTVFSKRRRVEGARKSRNTMRAIVRNKRKMAP